MEELAAFMISGGGESILPRVTKEVVEGKSGQIEDGMGMGLI